MKIEEFTLKITGVSSECREASFWSFDFLHGSPQRDLKDFVKKTKNLKLQSLQFSGIKACAWIQILIPQNKSWIRIQLIWIHW
jgi:hypothetical protein